MTVTAITPTGDRPLAFALCQNWVRNQTLQPDQWIVVDDGRIPLEPAMPMEYIRREPKAEDPKHTLLPNLKAAIPLVKGDRVVILEDDEYYAPGYIKEMLRHLNEHLVVGIMQSKYYHLPSGKYMQICNATHASLAETGFRRSFLEEFNGLLVGDPYLDMRLWKLARNRGHLFIDAPEPLYLGIKGLPGRAGIGMGHSVSIYRPQDSADRQVLRRWVPKDYQVYLDILSGRLTQENYEAYFGWMKENGP